MTASAQQFITPLTFQALCGNPVHTDCYDRAQEQAMSHILLARWADILLIAPATANSLARLANGLADDLLSTLYLAAECPVFVAPAMNQAMWHKPITQTNISRLLQDGVKLIGPEAGEQACGETGFGRMTEPEIICQQVFNCFSGGILQNTNLLITAGPTREPLDPVRFISNRSSGKMGYALANAAINAGANVTLISGPVNLTAPSRAKLLKVETAEQMFNAVMSEIEQTDIYVGAAAIADYRPTVVQDCKIKKLDDNSVITLAKNVDIISAVANLPAKPFVVGFAAETDNLEHYARKKLVEKKLDMIAANWVGNSTGGFDSDENALQVLWADGEQNLGMTNKQQLAVELLKLIAQQFKTRKPLESGQKN